MTRWDQGVTPADPVAVLKRLKSHVDRAREAAASARRNEVDSWGSLTGGLDHDIRAYVQQSGLLAGMYYVIITWVPSSQRDHDCDVAVVRYFDGLWADMSRRIYNIGDQSQTVSFSEGEVPTFDQERALREIADIHVRIDDEVGKSVARLHIQLNLEGFPYRNDSIGFVDGFGYRFRATKAIVCKRLDPTQTNDYLGAPMVIPCHRFNLLVCIPKSCFRGSPSALSSSNRSMLRVLMELDDAAPDVIESLLWPRGRRYEMSSAADAPLKAVPRVAGMIENLPHPLQEALKQPADLNRMDTSIRDILSAPESTCFLLDLHAPHPSLTHIIVWRLQNPEPETD